MYAVKVRPAGAMAMFWLRAFLERPEGGHATMLTTLRRRAATYPDWESADAAVQKAKAPGVLIKMVRVGGGHHL